MPNRIPGISLLPILLATFLSFWNLGVEPLRDWDEAWHARIALEMLRAGEWWIYLYEGRADPLVFKPPLWFFAAIPSMRLFGPTEWAVRVFSALCFVGLVAATVGFCRRVFVGPVDLLAGLLLCSLKRVVFEHFARDASMDAPLALFLSLTMFALWSAAGPAGTIRVSSWRATASFALALLVKGVAALQIVPPITLWFAIRRDGRGLLRLVRVVLVALLPVAIWIWLREQRDPGFVAGMIELDVYGRLTRKIGDQGQPTLLYLTNALRDFQTIGLCLLGLLILARGRIDLESQLRTGARKRSLLLFLGLWGTMPLLAFQSARTAHPWYALPSYLPLVILAAWTIVAGLASTALRLREPRRHPAFLAGLCLVIVVVGWKSPWRVLRDTGPEHPEILARRREIDTLLEVVGREQQGVVVLVPSPSSLPALGYYLERAGVTARSNVDLAAISPRAEPTFVAIELARRGEVEHSLPLGAALVAVAPAMGWAVYRLPMFVPKPLDSSRGVPAPG